MKGICRLYEVEAELKESHLIPKFAFDYTKKTASRFLLGFANPNVRMQDGPKKYGLSQNAETEFSKRETWFAKNVFYPYLAGATLLGGNSKGLSSIKINPAGGFISFPKTCNDSYMIPFFKNRILQQKQLPDISEKQKKVIEQDFEKHKEVFLKSDAADSMRNDLFLSRNSPGEHFDE